MEIKAKICKVGTSYAVFIPKALIDCGVLPTGKEIKLIVENPAMLKGLSFRLNSLTESFWKFPKEALA